MKAVKKDSKTEKKNKQVEEVEKKEVKKSEHNKEVEIEYDSSKKFFHYYSEASGVVAQKNKILKRHNAKASNYISYVLRGAGIFVSVVVAAMILAIKLKYNSLLNDMLFLLFVGSAIAIFMIFNFLLLFYNKKNGKKGILKANKHGIINECNRNVFETKYDDIDLIVVTRRLIVFISDDQLLTFVKKNQAFEILDYIKNNSNVKIIENNNTECSRNLSISALLSVSVMVCLLVVLFVIYPRGAAKKVNNFGTYKQQVTASGYDISLFKSINRDEFVDLLNRNDDDVYFVLVGGSSSCSNCKTTVDILRKSIEHYDYEVYYLDSDTILDFSDSDILNKSEAFTNPGTSFGLVPMIYVIKNGEVIDVHGGAVDYDEYSSFLMRHEVPFFGPNAGSINRK